VVSQSVEATDNFLYGVSAISADDVWAVGSYVQAGLFRTLTMHGDGTQWSILPSPNAGASSNYLLSVAALSTDDVWAVGEYDQAGVFKTLIMHWDGTQWNAVASPNAGAGHNFLQGVTAVSTDDVWAVGRFLDPFDSNYRTLTIHWDGTQWSVVSSPSPGSESSGLEAVSAITDNDVWAVGNYSSGGASQTLTMRWNDGQWTVISSPNAGAGSNSLYGLSVRSANDIWAVGNYSGSGGVDQTLLMRWNGSLWSILPTPNPGTVDNELQSVSTLSANNVWAVGSYRGTNGREFGFASSLILHWDGTGPQGGWEVVPNPNPGSQSDALYAVDALSASDIWAVGNYEETTSLQTLVERYNDPCALPTATNTPILPTATATITP